MTLFHIYSMITSISYRTTLNKFYIDRWDKQFSNNAVRICDTVILSAQGADKYMIRNVCFNQILVDLYRMHIQNTHKCNIYNKYCLKCNIIHKTLHNITSRHSSLQSPVVRCRVTLQVHILCSARVWRRKGGEDVLWYDAYVEQLSTSRTMVLIKYIRLRNLQRTAIMYAV